MKTDSQLRHEAIEKLGWEAFFNAAQIGVIVKDIKMDKYVLMIHGDTEETQKARDILQNSKAWKDA